VTTLSDLQRDARTAQAALIAEQEKQAAAAKAAAAEQAARSIEWSWATIVAYSQRQAEASYAVTQALAAFSAAVVEDLALAARLYLNIVRAMAPLTLWARIWSRPGTSSGRRGAPADRTERPRSRRRGRTIPTHSRHGPSAQLR
jgi:hypothetical protein